VISVPRKKHPIEWTTEEALRRLFHPKILRKVREELDAIDNPEKPPKSKSKKNTKPNDR
jgi:hypothetical protein